MPLPSQVPRKGGNSKGLVETFVRVNANSPRKEDGEPQHVAHRDS
ncbi:3169_t:CDS:2 [Funneliformis geosporum]|uniref:19373_t:CDS:1 n=1 Tax=Funneliformis geosporum TaxID=1117311 RepID=A0A9W4WSQ9_9GLOM|nr:3169_t:CDS:2 [Funneliformis geosporum]CAI2183158.1 19373_t:CDS:2 [Funneliformis geosporum]